jgi:hypothetical protein
MLLSGTVVYLNAHPRGGGIELAAQLRELAQAKAALLESLRGAPGGGGGGAAAAGGGLRLAAQADLGRCRLLVVLRNNMKLTTRAAGGGSSGGGSDPAQVDATAAAVLATKLDAETREAVRAAFGGEPAAVRWKTATGAADVAWLRDDAAPVDLPAGPGAQADTGAGPEFRENTARVLRTLREQLASGGPLRANGAAVSPSELGVLFTAAAAAAASGAAHEARASPAAGMVAAMLYARAVGAADAAVVGLAVELAAAVHRRRDAWAAAPDDDHTGGVAADGRPAALHAYERDAAAVVAAASATWAAAWAASLREDPALLAAAEARLRGGCEGAVRVAGTALLECLRAAEGVRAERSAVRRAASDADRAVSEEAARVEEARAAEIRRAIVSGRAQARARTRTYLHTLCLPACLPAPHGALAGRCRRAGGAGGPRRSRNPQRAAGRREEERRPLGLPRGPRNPSRGRGAVRSPVASRGGRGGAPRRSGGSDDRKRRRHSGCSSTRAPGWGWRRRRRRQQRRRSKPHWQVAARRRAEVVGAPSIGGAVKFRLAVLKLLWSRTSAAAAADTMRAFRALRKSVAV